MSEAFDPLSVAQDLSEIDVSDPMIFKNDAFRPIFARLRQEAPVHYCKESPFGPYWSITRFHDIMAVDKNHHDFSSQGGVSIGNRSADFEAPNFISMDPPKHDLQRKAVTGVVAPMNLAKLEPVIRQRAGWILDELPTGESFNWVEHVSVELTTQMLATIFDFPFEERHKLTAWSDLATSSVATGGTLPDEDRREGLMQCLSEFTDLWNERVHWDPREHNDLITLMANDPATSEMDPMEYLGNLILLIVGGNDTTRNSISGGVLALNKNPDQYEKLLQNPGLIPKMVPEIIRWQTPLAHMARTALADTELGGKQIKKGDRVAMWYISGNRDEDYIDQADKFIIDRPNPRTHTAFGYGVHRCVGNRLAEMQLRVMWEEIQNRFPRVEVTNDPVLLGSSFVHGIRDLPVTLRD